MLPAKFRVLKSARSRRRHSAPGRSRSNAANPGRAKEEGPVPALAFGGQLLLEDVEDRRPGQEAEQAADPGGGELHQHADGPAGERRRRPAATGRRRGRGGGGAPGEGEVVDEEVRSAARGRPSRGPPPAGRTRPRGRAGSRSGRCRPRRRRRGARRRPAASPRRCAARPGRSPPGRRGGARPSVPGRRTSRRPPAPAGRPAGRATRASRPRRARRSGRPRAAGGRRRRPRSPPPARLRYRLRGTVRTNRSRPANRWIAAKSAVTARASQSMPGKPTRPPSIAGRSTVSPRFNPTASARPRGISMTYFARPALGIWRSLNGTPGSTLRTTPASSRKIKSSGEGVSRMPEALPPGPREHEEHPLRIAQVAAVHQADAALLGLVGDHQREVGVAQADGDGRKRLRPRGLGLRRRRRVGLGGTRLDLRDGGGRGGGVVAAD